MRQFNLLSTAFFILLRKETLASKSRKRRSDDRMGHMILPGARMKNGVIAPACAQNAAPCTRMGGHDEKRFGEVLISLQPVLQRGILSRKNGADLLFYAAAVSKRLSIL